MSLQFGNPNLYSTSASAPSGTEITMCGFVYFRTLPSGMESCAADLQDALGQNSLAWKTDGNFYRIGDGVPDQQFASNPEIGTWFFFATTNSVSGSSRAGYWGNIGANALVTVTSATASALSTPTMTIGQEGTVAINPSAASQWADAAVAGVRLYSASLSSAELVTEMASLTPVRTTNLVGYWPLLFDGSTSLDYSGNANNLTPNTGQNGAVPTTQTDPPLQIAIIQDVLQLSAGSEPFNVSFSILPAVGSTVVVAVASASSTATSTVTDNQGNTYTKQVAVANGTSGMVAIYTTVVKTSAGTYTVTVDGNASAASAVIAEVFGANVVGPFSLVELSPGTTSNTSGSATTFSCPAGTSTVAEDLLFMVFTSNGQSGITWTSPLTTLQNSNTGSPSKAIYVGTGLITSGSGAQTGQATGGVSASYSAAALLLRPAGSPNVVYNSVIAWVQ